VQRFGRLVAFHPIVFLVAIGALTLVALHGIVDLRTGQLRLRIDPSIERLLPEGDDERRFFDRTRQVFGGEDFVVVMLDGPGDVFETASLERVARLSKRLEAIEGVAHVVSIANATEIAARDADVYVGPFFETPPTDPAELARLRDAIRAHPFYGKTLVTRDGRGAVLIVTFEHLPERELLERRLSAQVAEVAEAERGPATVWITGAPHAKLAISETLVRELKRVLPLLLVLTVLLTALTFRTVRGAVLPVVTIVLALVWTLGAMGWAGSSLNLVSNLVPPLLVTLGFAAALHVVSEYYEALLHHPARTRTEHSERVALVLTEMGVAAIVNGLTTVLGFASLCTSVVVAVRLFGFWSVVGVVATTVLAVVFLPAALAFLGPPRRAAARRVEPVVHEPTAPIPPHAGWIDALAERLALFDVRHRRAILWTGVGVLVVAALAMTRIEVATTYIGDFPEDSPVRRGYEEITARVGGTSAFSVVVDADEPGAMARPENLRALRELQDWIEAQPEVATTASIADSVVLLHRALLGPEATEPIPHESKLVKQLLLFGGDAVTRGFLDRSQRSANIQVRSNVSDSKPVRAFLERLDARLAELPRRLQARATGDLVLLNRTVDSIAVGELQSLGTAFFTIYLTLAAMLTSFRIGLIAMLPNLLPIAVYYGTLGATGIPLTLSTSLIGSIALGIAVDDTVHYLARFNLEARRLGDETRATVETLRSVIRPVSFTTLGLVMGFLVLTTSETKSQQQFGWLAAFTMAVAWALELTLSPALSSGIRLVTLWDLLALDLGPNPHHQIPLFEGLSPRQARIFALMASVVSAPAGDRLMTHGTQGDEMFVVLDGELVASLERDGRRAEFSRMHRGDTVGEIGLFHGVRTADVDVSKDARLLRFGEAELTRLGRRYPRIAARVYRNLNHVIARRVVSTAQALG
jgi:predicted RND superfamily exporter protein